MNSFTASDGTHIHYIDEGAGAPVILAHGWFADAGYFEEAAALLRGHCRCIRYDQRGHGLSDTPFAGRSIDRLARDLRELIVHLGLRAVTVVGHSMGGLAVYGYVSRYGCRDLAALGVMDMSPKPMADADWKSGAFSLDLDNDTWLGGLESAAQSAAALGWDAMRPALPFLLTPLACMESLLPRGVTGPRPPAALAGLWFAMMDVDYRADLPRVTVPAVYMRPEEAIYPPSTQEYFLAHVAGPAEAVFFPGSNHVTMGYDAPRLAGAVDRLLSTAGAEMNNLGEMPKKVLEAM